MDINLHTKILDKVLTPGEYNKKSYSDPYILEFLRDKQGLLFYGTEHSQDPSHPKFSDIESRFQSFLNQYSSQNILLALESVIPPENISREEMIKKYRETGFLKFLSGKYGGGFFCPEPQGEIISLLLSFTRATPVEVACWMFLNYLAYEHENSSPQDYITSISKFIKDIDYDTIRTGLAAEILLPDSPEKIKDSINKISEKAQLLEDPVGPTIFNLISSDFRNTRDRYIARGIISVLEQGKSVFAVFGTNHAIAQEPAFNAWFEMG